MKFAIAALVAAGLTAAQPVMVDRAGSWSLARLGYGESVRTVERGTLAFAYRTPPGTVQGAHHRWYGVHLHALLELDPDAPPSPVTTVAADSSGGVCFSELLHVGRAGDKLIITWYAGNGGFLDVAGDARPVLAIDDRSSCIIPAIHGGVNTIRVWAAGFGRHARLRIFPDSGVVVTRRFLQPLGAREVGPDVRISYELTRTRAHVARPLELELELRGGKLEHDVDVRVRVPRGPLELLSPGHIRLRTLRSLQRTRLRIRVVGRRAGLSYVVVSAGSERALIVVPVHA